MEVEAQIIKAIGYLPTEEIVICGSVDVIFDSDYEVIMKYDGYLIVGVTKKMMPKITGKAYQIKS
jgi:hypothetical protein